MSKEILPEDSGSSSPDQPALPQKPDGYQLFAEYADSKKAHEHGLVVLAMGLSYWITKNNDRYVLYAPTGTLDEIRRQIQLYEEEQLPIRRLNEPWPEENFALTPLAVVVVLWVGFFLAQEHWTWLEDYGSNSSQAIFLQGHWWRPLTALCLHADGIHLAINSLTFLLFGAFSNAIYGYGRSLLCTVLAGSAGNLLTSWLYYPATHLSLGASTAIFGQIGLICGAILAVRRRFHPERRRDFFLAFTAVLAVFTVSGGTQARETGIDYLAHWCGFACGLLFGYLVRRFMRQKSSDRCHQVDGYLALFLVLAAWMGAAQVASNCTRMSD